jgi:heme exporter protein A
MLEASGLECIRGDRRLFSDLSFALNAGELLQVRGPNGAGKTSLLRMLCGLVAPVEGEIRWKGSTIKELGEDFYREITYLGHLPAVKDELTAEENLRIASALDGIEIEPKEAYAALNKLGLRGRETLPAKVLSAGQRRRVSLARLLVAGSALWVLDEPLTALDRSAVELVRGMLVNHLAQGGVAVLTTHQDLDLPSRHLELGS